MPMHPTISKRKPYSPYFNPNQFSPALWLDASDQSTLVMDGAASFVSASSQYLSCASNSTLQTGNVSYWLGFWVKSTLGANQHFASKGASGAAGYEWKLQTQSNNTFRFQVLSSNAAEIDSATSGSATFTNWNFLLCYKDVGGNVGIILNGNNPVTTPQTVTQVAGTAALELGKFGAGYFDGQLDSVVFGKPSDGWLASNATALAAYLYNSGNGRRSSDFINSSYYTGGNPSGAVSWWDLDEVTGTRKDRIGTNDLTDNNSVGYASGIASGNVQYDGDPVKQWNDKSGNARHVTAATIATSPTYKTNIQNSNSSVLFDGVNDCFKILNQPFFRNISNGTIICVRKSALAATNAYKTLIEISTTADSTRAAIYHTDTAKKLQIAGSNTDGGSPSYISATNDATTNAEILTGFFNYKNASVSLYLNNTLIISNNYFGTGNLNPGQFTPDTNCYALSVGATSYAAGSLAFFNGYIYEIFVFNKLLTSIEYQKIKQYLANKWGITLS